MCVNLHRMVEKASKTREPARRRGRPPAFDAEEVVEAAVGAFFADGFHGTSLADLEAATGQDRSTLYNSFGGKSGLYHQATARYVDAAAVGLFGPLSDENQADDALEAVVAFFERIRSGLTAGDVSPGCLIVNDMAAASDPPAAQRYRDLLEDGLRAALERAAEAGAISETSVENRVALLSAAVIGINLISRHTGDNDQVHRMIDGAIAELETWRT